MTIPELMQNNKPLHVIMHGGRGKGSKYWSAVRLLCNGMTSNKVILCSIVTRHELADIIRIQELEYFYNVIGEIIIGANGSKIVFAAQHVDNLIKKAYVRL